MNRKEAKSSFWENGGVFERGLSTNYEKVIKTYFIGIEFDDFIDKMFDDFDVEKEQFEIRIRKEYDRKIEELETSIYNLQCEAGII